MLLDDLAENRRCLYRHSILRRGGHDSVGDCNAYVRNRCFKSTTRNGRNLHRMCNIEGDMPTAPGRVGPLGLALTAYDVWRRLPPTQRKLVLQQVRRYGPVVATQALRSARAAAPPARSPRRRALRGRSGPARAGAPSGSPRSGSPARGGRRSGAGRPCGRASSRRCRIERHAPMFCGSSCAQTTSWRLGYERDERRDLLGRERVELLDAARPRRGRRPAQLVPDDVVVDLPRAEDEPRVRSWSAGRVVEHRLEAPSARSARLDAASFRRSSPFGVITTSGRATGVERLPPEQVEVLRGGRTG